MDPQDQQVARRAITYGQYVVTASMDGSYAAGGVNWLTQVAGVRDAARTPLNLRSTGMNDGG